MALRGLLLLVLTAAFTPRAEAGLSCLMRLFRAEAPFVLRDDHIRKAERLRLYANDIELLLSRPETAVRTRVLLESLDLLAPGPTGFYEDVAWGLRSMTYSPRVPWLFRLDARRWFHSQTRFGFRFRLASDMLRRHQVACSRDTIGHFATFLESFPDANWMPTKEERIQHIVALGTPYTRRIYREFKREFTERMVDVITVAHQYDKAITSGQPLPDRAALKRWCRDASDYFQLALLELLGTEFKRETALWNRVEVDELRENVLAWLERKGFSLRLREVLAEFLVEYVDPWNPTGPRVEGDEVYRRFDIELRREATRLVAIVLQIRTEQLAAARARIVPGQPRVIEVPEPPADEADEDEVPQPDEPNAPRPKARARIALPLDLSLTPPPAAGGEIEFVAPPLSAGARKALLKAEWDTVLSHLYNVSFHDASRLAASVFGEPRTSGGSHFVYTPPWPGAPIILTRHRGAKLPMYQAKELKKALDRMRETYAKELGK